MQNRLHRETDGVKQVGGKMVPILEEQYLLVQYFPANKVFIFMSDLCIYIL